MVLERGWATALGAMQTARIFTKFDGVLGVPEGNNGTNYITGGTGKYVGISGKGPWACGYAGTNGELYCAQSLDYELP